MRARERRWWWRWRGRPTDYAALVVGWSICTPDDVRWWLTDGSGIICRKIRHKMANFAPSALIIMYSHTAIQILLTDVPKRPWSWGMLMTYGIRLRILNVDVYMFLLPSDITYIFHIKIQCDPNCYIRHPFSVSSAAARDLSSSTPTPPPFPAHTPALHTKIWNHEM